MKKEWIAGFTTFLTMSYIIIVNPLMLSTPGTGITFSAALTATILSSCIATLVMGLWGRVPFALAPGMGLNAFFTFHLILAQKIPWPTALGMTFCSAILSLILTMTKLRHQILKSIPDHLQLAMSMAIGVFIAFIGLKNAGIITGDAQTLVKSGILGREALVVVLGVFVILFCLKRNSPFSYLLGILFVSVFAYFLGNVKVPEKLFSEPDFSMVGKLDILGALHWSLIPAIVTLMVTDLFDTLSTFVGITQNIGGLEEEFANPRSQRFHRALVSDSLGSAISSLVGTSPTTTYIESAAGIQVGGRTGLTAIIVSLCFLPFLVLGPMIQMLPTYATSPVLIVIGALMFRNCLLLKVLDLEDLIPTFLMVLMVPLTFSLTQGLLWGFFSHVALYTINGRRKEISPFLAFLGLLGFVFLFLNGVF